MKKMDLFKIGLYLGMGATVGKWFSGCINAVLDGICIGVVQGMAAQGNKTCQAYCENVGWKYDSPKDESSGIVYPFTNGEKK